MKTRRREDGEQMQAIEIVVGVNEVEEGRAIRRGLEQLANRVTVLHDRVGICQYLERKGSWTDERRSPDLVVLDVELFGTDEEDRKECWELLERLQKRPEYSDTTFAMLAKHVTKPMVDRAWKAGVSLFMRKPVTMDSVAVLLEEVEDHQMAVVRIGTRHGRG